MADRVHKRARVDGDNMDLLPITDALLRPKNVPFQRPIELTCYSLDEKRELHLCTPTSGDHYEHPKHLPFYYPPDIATTSEKDRDLNEGYPAKYIQRDESIPEHLDTLLAALKDLRLKQSELHDLDQVDIITWRGIMTRLLCIPYAKDSFCFRACRYRNTLYIEEPPDKKTCLRQRQNHRGTSGDRQERMCYWGYKFEKLMTVDSHPSKVTEEELKSRVESPVNTNVQYCTVVKTKLGRHSLVMGAEVDCTRDYKYPNDASRFYTELKTSKVIRNDRDRQTFERHKLLKFYFQSFLVAIPTIVVGFRDDKGIIQHLETLETLKIPRIVRDKQYWDPNVCLAFCDRLLDWIRSCVTVDDQNTTYLITYDHPYTDITIEREQNPMPFVTETSIV